MIPDEEQASEDLTNVAQVVPAETESAPAEEATPVHSDHGLASPSFD